MKQRSLRETRLCDMFQLQLYQYLTVLNRALECWQLRTDALHVPIDLEHDIEVDYDGISYLISNGYVGVEKDCEELSNLMDDVTDLLYDYYGDFKRYKHL